MSIEVIGAGTGRTGTLSLKHALEELGYVKCHHMIELLQNPPQLPYWQELHHTGKTDFDKVLQGYRAVVDFPGAIYYKAMMEKYPDAKVILTVRDPEKWYKSACDTIFNMPKGFDRFMMKLVGLLKPDVGHVSRTLDFANEAIWKGLFQDRFSDKAFAIDFFNRWNAEVQRVVPADKLLVFEVKDGWEPLCAFLNKPVPAIPFPKVNDTAEFNARKKKLT
jgi:hypothetical protein